MKAVVFALGIGACSVASAVLATDLVYRPINPSFGGDPLNGPTLLNQANAQNRHKEPAEQDDRFSQQSPLQQFNDQLQRAVLGRIASSVSGGLFNSSGQLIPGVVETAEFRIAIVDLGGGVLSITTTDKVSGQSTTFQVAQ
jgi:curli production assembly/transport component CsgF